jgi:hypothetical protein
MRDLSLMASNGGAGAERVVLSALTERTRDALPGL